MDIAQEPYLRAMLGALVGDAAGATLEFGKRPVTKEMAEAAIRMPGGGAMGVGPGQITDDGELTLALWNALNPWNSYTGIPRTNMVRAYAEWIESRPFDCGGTCGYAFMEASEVVHATEPGQSLNYERLQEFAENVKNRNADSQANGACMRSTAIASWVASHALTPIMRCAAAARADAELSHPNEVCCEVNELYTLACCLLMRGYTPSETFKRLDEYVHHAIKEQSVRDWFLNDSIDISTMECETNMGHVRWGFTLAIHFLRNPHISYEDAIRTTLMKGGDTDTNACIVGGLVGCYQPIPDYMLRPVLTFDCQTDGIYRPEKYSVKKTFGYLISL
jgi:ADP-ribosylglycohydrolase